MKKNLLYIIVILITISILFYLTGCGNNKNTVQPNINVQLLSPLNTSSQSTYYTLEIVVTADDITTITVSTEFSSVQRNASISVDIPIGTDRTITAYIKENSTILFSGSKTLDITDSINKINIILTSASGDKDTIQFLYQVYEVDLSPKKDKLAAWNYFDDTGFYVIDVNSSVKKFYPLNFDFDKILQLYWIDNDDTKLIKISRYDEYYNDNIELHIYSLKTQRSTLLSDNEYITSIYNISDSHRYLSYFVDDTINNSSTIYRMDLITMQIDTYFVSVSDIKHFCEISFNGDMIVYDVYENYMHNVRLLRYTQMGHSDSIISSFPSSITDMKSSWLNENMLIIHGRIYPDTSDFAYLYNTTTNDSIYIKDIPSDVDNYYLSPDGRYIVMLDYKTPMQIYDISNKSITNVTLDRRVKLNNIWFDNENILIYGEGVGGFGGIWKYNITSNKIEDMIAYSCLYDISVVGLSSDKSEVFIADDLFGLYKTKIKKRYYSSGQVTTDFSFGQFITNDYLYFLDDIGESAYISKVSTGETWLLPVFDNISWSFNTYNNKILLKYEPNDYAQSTIGMIYNLTTFETKTINVPFRYWWVADVNNDMTRIYFYRYKGHDSWTDTTGVYYFDIATAETGPVYMMEGATYQTYTPEYHFSDDNKFLYLNFYGYNSYDYNDTIIVVVNQQSLQYFVLNTGVEIDYCLISPDNSKMAFTSGTYNDSYSLYYMNIPSNNNYKVYLTNVTYSSFRWSDNNNLIIISDNIELNRSWDINRFLFTKINLSNRYVTNIGYIEMSDENLESDWQCISRDKTKIVYFRFNGIYYRELNPGSEEVRLSYDFGMMPSFSPDGTQIVYYNNFGTVIIPSP